MYNMPPFDSLPIHEIPEIRLRNSVQTWLRESHNNWGWTAPMEIMQSNSSALKGPGRTSCSGLYPVGFWMSPRMETLHPSWATCLTIFIVKKLFSCPLLQIVTTAFHPVTWYYLEEFDLTSFAPSLHQVFTHFGKILPEPSFLEARQSQLSQPFLSVLPYLPWGKSFWGVLDLTTLEDAWKNLF